MHAEITQEPVLSALTQQPACEDGIIDFELSGDNVINQGDTLKYFADALSASNLTVDINIGEAVRRGLGLDLGCISESGSNSSSSRLLF